MKWLLILLLVACAPVSTGPMEGERTMYNVQGYTEMCKREPESELCNK